MINTIKRVIKNMGLNYKLVLSIKKTNKHTAASYSESYDIKFVHHDDTLTIFIQGYSKEDVKKHVNVEKVIERQINEEKYLFED